MSLERLGTQDDKNNRDGPIRRDFGTVAVAAEQIPLLSTEQSPGVCQEIDETHATLRFRNRAEAAVPTFPVLQSRGPSAVLGEPEASS